eukprot:g43700.t1
MKNTEGTAKKDVRMLRLIQEVNTTTRSCVLWDLEENTEYIVHVQSITLSGCPVQLSSVMYKESILLLLLKTLLPFSQFLSIQHIASLPASNVQSTSYQADAITDCADYTGGHVPSGTDIFSSPIIYFNPDLVIGKQIDL